MPVLWEEEDITVRGRQQKSVRQYHSGIPPCEIVVVVSVVPGGCERDELTRAVAVLHSAGWLVGGGGLC